MVDIFSVRLEDLLPASLRRDPDAEALAKAITPELQEISLAIAQCVLISRIDELSSAVLDLLAWQWHVDFYDISLPIEQKRELVKNALAWHKRKGTPSAVEELVQATFYSGEVQEWWEYGGEPGFFKVVVTDPSATNERAQEFIAAVNSVKRASAWLESVEIKTVDDIPLYFGNILHMGEYMTLKQVV